MVKSFLTLFVLLCSCFWNEMEGFSLRENLQYANVGDFVVTAQGKSFTLLHIYSRTPELLTIEEITVPNNRLAAGLSWRDWVSQGAPGSTSWLLYAINIATGKIEQSYSISKRGWIDLSQQGESFLPILLNLPFVPVPEKERKRVGTPPDTGSPDWRKAWQPKMVVDRREIPNVKFEAWRTHWPKDGSELSGRTIEIYLPQEESQRYPSYFPYWLQIKGAVGKANVRIIDSGSKLLSPAPPIPTMLQSNQ